MKQPTNLELTLCDGLPWGLKLSIAHDMTEDFGDLIDDLSLSGNEFKEDSIWELSAINTGMVCLSCGEGYFDDLLLSKPNVYIAIERDAIKPIVFPLSALTKEITISDYNDGKPFVPLCKMFELNPKKARFKDIGSAGIVIYKCSVKGDYEPFDTFDMEYAKPAQMDLLRQWHFNTRSLSETEFINAEGLNVY